MTIRGDARSAAELDAGSLGVWVAKDDTEWMTDSFGEDAEARFAFSRTRMGALSKQVLLGLPVSLTRMSRCIRWGYTGSGQRGEIQSAARWDRDARR
jgi:hypothetical protein